MPKQAPDLSNNLTPFLLRLLVLLAFIGGVYFLHLLTPVLTILFFSGFLTILFSPFLDHMERYKIPNWLWIMIIFLLFLGFFLLASFAIIPIFIKQISLLFKNTGDFFFSLEQSYRSGGISAIGLPSWILWYAQSFDFGGFFEFVRSHASSLGKTAADWTGKIASGSADIVSSISGGVFQIIMILVFTFFMSLERTSVRRVVYDILPETCVRYLRSREDRVMEILAAWVRGQLLLGLSIFFLTLVGLFALGLFGIRIEGIFTLALIAGLMEFIPYVWPFLALMPALAIAAGMWLIPVVVIFILYILIQQAENNILVPMIMSKSLDLSPLLILVTMTAGASLFGIVGILLAIPFAALIKIAISDFIAWKKQKTAKDPQKIRAEK